MVSDPNADPPAETGAAEVAALLDLADWRRRVAALYADVRVAAALGDDACRVAWTRFWEERDRLFRDHPQSPLEPAERAAHRGVPRFPYDPAARAAARAEPVVDATPIAVTLAGDGAFTMVPAARLVFELYGRELELTLYRIGGYGNGLFLPFGDASNGRPGPRASYGGGRYLIDTLKYADLGAAVGDRVRPDDNGGARLGADRGVNLDFNYAFHPSCAYSPRWDCPLAPPGNRLSVAIEAGEAYRAG